MIELVRALSSRQGTLSQCALAIAVDPAPPAEAHPPAPAPAPAPLSPPRSFLPSKVDIEGVRYDFVDMFQCSIFFLEHTPYGIYNIDILYINIKIILFLYLKKRWNIGTLKGN